MLSFYMRIWPRLPSSYPFSEALYNDSFRYFCLDLTVFIAARSKKKKKVNPTCSYRIKTHLNEYCTYLDCLIRSFVLKYELCLSVALVHTRLKLQMVHLSSHDEIYSLQVFFFFFSLSKCEVKCTLSMLSVW